MVGIHHSAKQIKSFLALKELTLYLRDMKEAHVQIHLWNNIRECDLGEER